MHDIVRTWKGGFDTEELGRSYWRKYNHISILLNSNYEINYTGKHLLLVKNYLFSYVDWRENIV